MSSLPKILIVDDYLENLMLLHDLLREIDAEIVLALSGAEAIKLAWEHRFALVLLDVEMPEMNGYETAKRILKEPQNKNCPLIFVTGAYHDDLHQLEAYTTGAVDYILKPFNGLILRSKVKVFLKLYQQQTALENLYQELKEENEKNKRHRQDLINRISKHMLHKSDLAKSNARMLQEMTELHKEILELNRENLRLHHYIENHLNHLMQYTDSN